MAAAIDDLFTHRPLTDDGGWFDRFYMNIHSPGTNLTLSLGMGRYPQVGVIDGFASLVGPGGQQRNFRASREAPAGERRLEAGPLSAEIIEPLRRWRLRLGDNELGFSCDFQFEGDVAPIDAGRIERRSRKTGALLDWSHFVQVGRIQGRLVVDGAIHELAPEAWYGARDRSWGIRPGTGVEPPREAPSPTAGRHDWVFGRIGDQAVFYLLSGGGSRGPHLLGAGLSGPRGATRVTAVERVLDWDERGRFRGARATLRTESGETIGLTAHAPSATIYLRGGLYGGWRGLAQGMPRGNSPVCEGERWATSDPALLAEVAGLNDHVCRFESGSGSGFGIYEVASGF
jgi:hypothetical protein